MKKINVLIFGSTGYIGSQLVKMLISHKYINIKYLCGKSSIGKKFKFSNSPKKKILTIGKFNKKFLYKVDVVFTALPNGDAQKISKIISI